MSTMVTEVRWLIFDVFVAGGLHRSDNAMVFACIDSLEVQTSIFHAIVFIF